MKTIRHIYALLLLLFVVSIAVQAQNITKAEYYFDSDPGIGKGISLAVTVAANIVSIDQDISLTGLVPGIHSVFVRVQDANGKWSTNEGRVFTIYPDTTTQLKIVSSEYYFDFDPGVGKATSLKPFTASNLVAFNDTITFSGLSRGMHSISTRFKYSNGIWGLNQGMTINVDTFFSVTAIDEIEYFIDADPGLGKGAKITDNAGKAIVITNSDVNLASLNDGMHNISVRTKNIFGAWSTSFGIPFLIQEYKSAKINLFEYYLDTWVGLDSATKVLVDTPAYNVKKNFELPLTGLDTGSHYVYIRAQDSLKTSSHNTYRKIHICELVPDADFKPDTICSGVRVRFKNTSTGTDANTKYYWDLDNNGINDSLTFQPSKLFSATGSFSIRLIVSNGSKCVDTIKKNVVVVALDTAGVLASGPTVICEGDTVTLSSHKVAKQYMWSDGSTGKDLKVNTDGIFYLVVSNGYCNDTSRLLAISTKPVPYPPQLLSQNGAIYSNVIKGIQWYQAGSGLLTGETSQVLIPLSSGNYYAITTGANGCMSKSSDTIHFEYDLLDCYTDFSTVIDTVNLKVSFTNISTNSTDVIWNFGDGTYSYLKNPVHEYAISGRYNICLTSRDSVSGCLKRFCKEVIIGEMPCSAIFAFSVTQLTKTVVVNDLSSATTEWFWAFGDGSLANNKNAVHTYTADGLYKICHWVRNKTSNCFDQNCALIKIGSVSSTDLVSGFTYFLAEGSKQVTFSNKSSENATNYYWSFGDGNVSTEKEPVYSYAKSGKYVVCLKVFDSKTAQIDEYCEDLIIGEIECNVKASFASIVNADRSVIFYNQSIGAVDKFYWNFGDGVTSAQKAPTHSYTSPGYYLVSLSIRNELSKCADYYSEFVQVGESGCHASFDFIVNPVNDSVKLINTSRGSVTKYFWSFGDGRFSYLESPNIKYPKSGIYKVKLTAADPLLDCTDSYEAAIQVGKVNCSAKYSYYVDSIDNTVYFTNEALGETSDLLWTFGDGSLSKLSNPFHQYKKAGYYKVGLNTFNSASWCMDYYEETILIGNADIDCDADFTYQANESLNKVSFYDKSIGTIVGYYWNFGDKSDINTEKDPEYLYNKSGLFNVCHLVVNNKLISNITCKPVVASPGTNNTCRADFIFTVDSTKKAAYFTDVSEGSPTKWEWSFGNGKTDTKQNTSWIYAAKGFYLVGLRITNSKTGCINKTYKLINVGDLPKMRAGFAFEKKPYNTKAGGYPIDFIGAGLGDQAKLKWNFGDNADKEQNVDSTTTTPTHNYPNPNTKYYVCYEISDPVTGQKDSACQWVTTESGTEIVSKQLTTAFETYPNPFKEHITFAFFVEKPSIVELSIFDVDGRKVADVIRTFRNEGYYTVIWNAGELSSGVYFVKFSGIKNGYNTKLIIKE